MATPTPRPTRIRLCGELLVEQDGTRVDGRLPTRQARMLFALLVVHRDRALSRDTLADALWAGAPPPSRDASLRVLLTGARRVFGPGSIEGREHVRLLVPSDASIDVEEARRALARAEEGLEHAEFEAAADAARRVGQLTAEDLLTGLAAPWIDECRGEIEELSLRALEVEAQASLRAGRSSDAERLARRLVERTPYRESAHALLVQALGERGDVAEATLAFDRLRTLLREEVGTTPGSAVTALHERLVAGGPRDDGPRGLPPLPAPLARAAARPFVARSDELGRLRAGWEGARRGDPGIVVLAGEPGIGKTALAASMAREVHEQGATVLLGRCHAEALVPYEPFVEALRQLPPAALAERATELARVMPELGPGPARHGGDDDAGSRYLLFEAIARSLTDRARDVPVMLVLDDLHWADPPTLLLLKHLARTAEQTRLLITASYRTTEAPGTEQVIEVLTDLSREIPLERVPVTALGEDELGELVAAVNGAVPSPALGSALRRDTAGNPLFVGQLLRHLTEMDLLVERDGELVLAHDDRRGVPDGVKEVVGRRLAGLARTTGAVLDVAAVIGRGFSPDTVTALESLAPDAVLDALQDGTRAGLLEKAGVGGHVFVHALVREAIHERMPAGRRARLHRRVAETLAAARDPDPATLAHHFLNAGDRERGVEFSVQAARRDLGQLAFEDAATHLRRALDALADDDRPRRCTLLVALGDALARAGDTASAKETHRAAAELATSLASPSLLAEAALGYGGRIVWAVSREDPHLRPLLERALAGLDEEDSPIRVRLLARLGAGPLRDASIPSQRRHELTSEALAAARRIGDPGTLAYALDGYISAHYSPENTATQIELATELIGLAVEAGDLERAIEGYEHRGGSSLELGDVVTARADLAVTTDLAQRLRQPLQDWYVAQERAHHALLEGRLADAEELVARALTLGRRAHPWSAVVSHRLQLFVLRHLQGRLGEIADLLRRSVADHPTYLVLRCALAHAATELGQEHEARELLEPLAADDFRALPFDEEWLLSVCLLTETVRATDDARSAAVLHDRLLPYADRVAVGVPEVSIGSVARHLGILADTLSDTAAAARHFEVALEVNRRIGARPWLAHTQRDLAEVLLARDAPGDARRGRDLLRRAREAYSALGMGAWVERSARLL